MKMDKSSKVGGRRKAGSAASKSSKATSLRGNAVLVRNGRLGYTTGQPANGRPCKHKPTRRIR